VRIECRLDLNDDALLHQKIDPLSSQHRGLVLDIHSDLLLNREPALSELVDERSLVEFFEQAGTQLPMNFNCAANHSRAESFNLIWQRNFFRHL